MKLWLPWQRFVRQTQKWCFPHLYLNAIISTKFNFNCFKIVEVIHSTRFSRKHAVTMATLCLVHTQIVSCNTAPKYHHTYQIWNKLLKYWGSYWLHKVLVKLWLPWQRIVRQTQKTCLAHLHLKIINYPNFYFNCFKTVEGVRDARFCNGPTDRPPDRPTDRPTARPTNITLIPIYPLQTLFGGGIKTIVQTLV